MKNNIIISDFKLNFYEDKDLESFIEMFMNEELCQFMAGGAFDKRSGAESLFFDLKYNQKAYGVFLNDTLIGHFEANKTTEEIEIVYLLQKEYWGKEIMKTIIQYFNKNYSEKIIARILPNNLNSLKMIEKFDIENKKVSKFNNTQVIKYTLSKTMKKDYQEHWNTAYSKTDQTKLGWFEEKSEPTLNLIAKLNLDKNSSILNVGSGSSTLIDDLIKAGYTNLIANDISSKALENLKLRVGEKDVTYIIDDISKPTLLKQIESIDLWNDRAVLHFLTKGDEIKTYFDLLKEKVKVNGYVILSEFSTDGAMKCCGLDVKRYNTKIFQEELGSDFKLIEDFEHDYFNPNGDLRKYIYALFQREK